MKSPKHAKNYLGMPSGAGKIVCSCGYETPVVHDGDAFTLGRKVKTVDQYFADHLASEQKPVENMMVEPVAEQAVAPAQHSQPRSPKRKIEHR